MRLVCGVSLFPFLRVSCRSFLCPPPSWFAVQHISSAVAQSTTLVNLAIGGNTIRKVASVNHVHYNRSPYPFFQHDAKNRGLRCVLLPAPSGAGCKTRLESRIKRLKPHVVYWGLGLGLGLGLGQAEDAIMEIVHGNRRKRDKASH